MATPIRCLLQVTQVPVAQTTALTCPVGMRYIIDAIVASNNSGTDRTVAINIVPNGGGAGSTNLVLPAKAVINAAAAVYLEGMSGQVLEAGDFVSWIASAATAINARINGRAFTAT